MPSELNIPQFLDESDILIKSKRESELSEVIPDNSATTSNPTFQIWFQGAYQDFVVRNVSLKCLLYNTKNTRTKTMQKQFIAENNLPEDYFALNHESIKVQNSQHYILEKFLTTETELNIKKELKDNGQTKPLICDNSGTVWSGNRRLTIMRKLHKNGDRDFSSVKIIRLPKCNPQDLYNFEASEEMSKKTKVEFSWHAKAYQARELKEDSSINDEIVLKTMNYTKKEREIDLTMLEIGEKYLKKIGSPNNYEELDKSFQVLEYGAKEFLKMRNGSLRSFFEKYIIKTMEMSNDELKKTNSKSKYLYLVKILKNIQQLYEKSIDPNANQPKNPITGEPSPPTPIPPNDNEIDEMEKERKRLEKRNRYIKSLDDLISKVDNINETFNTHITKKKDKQLSLDKALKLNELIEDYIREIKNEL